MQRMGMGIGMGQSHGLAAVDLAPMKGEGRRLGNLEVSILGVLFCLSLPSCQLPLDLLFHDFLPCPCLSWLTLHLQLLPLYCSPLSYPASAPCFPFLLLTILQPIFSSNLSSSSSRPPGTLSQTYLHVRPSHPFLYVPHPLTLP